MNLSQQQAWYARRWVRVICGLAGVGLLLVCVPGPLLLTFLSVNSLGCLPGTACELWSAAALPLGGLSFLLAVSGGIVGVVQAARPRRALVMAQILLTAAAVLSMVGLIIAAQAASSGRAQVAAAQQIADGATSAGDAALREVLGFHPLWQTDPQGAGMGVAGTGPYQAFLACPLESGPASGYLVQVGYRLTGLDEQQAADLAAVGSLALPTGERAAASLTRDPGDPPGAATWQVVTECQVLPAP